MKRFLIGATVKFGLLAACAAPPPVVTAFNGDSVEIATPAAVRMPDGATWNEASRICSQAGKRAEWASSRPGRDSHIHLFLCLGAMAQAPGFGAPQAPGFGTPQTIIVR